MLNFTKPVLRTFLRYYLILSIVISSQSTIAQGFHLLKDINNSTDSKPSNIYNAPDGRSISAFALLNNVAYFSATDSGTNKLWRSDGTVIGTYVFQNSSASSITRCGNKIYFISDSAGYKVLAASDGTTSGTTIIKKFEMFDSPTGFVDIQDTLYFSLVSFTGNELWKSGGTKQSTSLIKILSGYASRISGIANVNGSAFFINNIFNTSDSLSGVWRSDGTAGGTKRIFSGTGFGLGVNPYAYNNKYYYSVSKFYDYLYVTDGTPSGTLQLAEVYYPHNFVSLNGTTYFSGRDNSHGAELWRTDGTKSGTYMLKDILPGQDSSSPQGLTGVGNNIYFHAKGANGNRNLWKIDGITQAVTLVKDFGADMLVAPSAFVNIHDMLFFTAYSETTGAELWKSDGSDGGTMLVKDIHAGQSNSYPNYLTQLNDKMLFAANDGLHGDEVWVSDGTETNTAILKDINPIYTSASIDRLQISKLKNRIFFSAISPAHDVLKKFTTLWSSDGTKVNTKNVTGIGTNAKISLIYNNHYSTENRIYFTALDNHYNMQLWYTDSAGTKFMTNIAQESGANFISDDYFLNGADLPGPFYSSDSNTYYFTLSNLWKIDERTNTVSLISKQARGSFFKINNQLFVASGTNLYMTDGSTNGITKISNATLSLDIYGNQQIASTIARGYFLSNGGLWKTNGTDTGTTLLNSVKPLFSQYQNKLFASINETLFFAGDDGITGSELWKTDGTPAGTRLVKDIFPGTGTGIVGHFCTVNNRIFFLANDGVHGTELWTSDGTEPGTVLVKDINLNPVISSFSSTKLGNKLAFLVYNTTLNRYVLWQSDGTAAGTFPIDDQNLKNVIISGSEFNLYEFNNELYFSGSTDELGSEIWVGTFGCKNSWTGASNNSWENPANWSCGVVPDENTDVIIDSGIIQLNSNVTIRTLHLNSGVIFTVGTGYHLTITH